MSFPLSGLPVLILDCQATGANPRQGHLLEIGWLGIETGKVSDPNSLPAQSSLTSLPAGAEIPSHVLRVTGILAEDLVEGVPPAEVWARIVEEAGRIAAELSKATCPTVIHFARYERPFLQQLHERTTHGTPFPLDIICSWEIVRRLLPQLPRRGLRAVSGYLGYSVPEKRRSAHHVIATAVIWNACVDMLEERHGITHLDQLRDWLSRTEVSKVRRRYPMDPNVRLALPDLPGLYHMLRSNGDVLYVGKATSLRKRVNSYFQKQTHHAEHILEMLTQARSIDINTTASALEAAMLESDSIKDLSPPYNVALRERDRAISFCTADLTKFDSKPSRSHQFGPVTGPELLRMIRLIWESGQTSPGIPPGEWLNSEMIGFPGGQGPGPEVLASGLEEFRLKHHNHVTARPTVARRVSILGFELWKQRQLEKARQEMEEGSAPAPELEEDSIEEIEKSIEWDTDRVVSLFESLTSRAAHLLRRARWFSLLSECSLTWETAPNTPQRAGKHLIVIDSGRIVERTLVKRNRQPPPPPGRQKKRLDRQRSFDLATYDRLSILTTELKRLCGSGRAIELRLGEKSTLTEVELQRVLTWL